MPPVSLSGGSLLPCTGWPGAVDHGRGARPVSRGIARNPVDHPNGGRTNGGKHWATPWGKPTKGKKTRSNKATQKFILRSRHDKKA